MTDLSVRIGRATWPTPIGLASGTCGYGKELEKRFEIDWKAVGAIFTKGLSLEPRRGNPPEWLGTLPGRMTEIESAAINAIGLENVGIDAFVRDKAPYLAEWRKLHGGRVFVNILGKQAEEYADLAARLDELDAIDGVELNLSCPNVSSGGIEFGRSAAGCAAVTERVRRATGKLVIVKLSPLADAAEIARAAEGAGADALSIANTMPVTLIDPEADPGGKRCAHGGLSGPALRPIAVGMTFRARCATRLPIIGVGGIGCARDALEFILAGASAIQVGTALFSNPNVAADIRDGLLAYLEAHGHDSVASIVGGAHEGRSGT